MRQASGRRPRLALLVVALAAIAAVCAVNAEIAITASPKPAAPLASAIVAASDAGSSAWYCAGAAAAPSGDQAALLMTNPGPKAVAGTVSTVAQNSSAVTRVDFSVPPDQQFDLPVGDGASTVLLRGGGVGVSEVVNGALG